MGKKRKGIKLFANGKLPHNGLKVTAEVARQLNKELRKEVLLRKASVEIDKGKSESLRERMSQPGMSEAMVEVIAAEDKRLLERAKSEAEQDYWSVSLN